MKTLVTKCTCDVCGREIMPETWRYVVGFGIGCWDDEMESLSIDNRKDMCRSCYETILALVNPTDAQKSDIVITQSKRRVAKDYDDKQIIDLWKKGCTWNDIMAKTGVGRGTIQRVVKLAKQNGETRAVKEHGGPKNDLGPKYKTVVDEYGCVISMERA